ncbi:hypothetical protein [Burkholderia ubonensis]|uniref:Uncharacterized protein n=1 Tax=Burkholderia ubonensis subsp. mesacidophila TaxID=265293 RepID=A0A2A4FBR1_9BURK|nr:hypothetical protein [Burkholderia ubonensis]PCE30801.1 hypothetical protein BZL54_19375 [Burkholderia ubonensis subsp. mesacidophila]
METAVTLRQAYLMMFEFLEREWERLDRPDVVGALLGNLALWGGPNGQGAPMDAAVFPEWLECAHHVLARDQLGGYANADIKLPPE